MGYTNNVSKIITLPVKYPTMTGCRPEIAYPMSIMYAYENTLPWIYNNFVTPICKKTTDGIVLRYLPKDFDEYIFLEKQVITRSLVKEFINDPIDFIVNLIYNQYYIILVIDQRFILNSDDGIPHPLFIYGYDINRNTFDVADLVSTSTGRYSFQKVKAEDVLKGLLSCNDDGSIDHIGPRMYCFKFNNSRKYNFDIELLRKHLYYYVNPSEFDYVDKEIEDNKINVFGIDVYDTIVKHFPIKNILSVICSLYDHKALMAERIKYLINNDYLNLANDDFIKFEFIRNEMLILLNSCLKSKVSINDDREKLYKISDKLFEIKEAEKILYQKILNLL